MPMDTLKAAEHLQEGGTFSPEQAKRIAETLSDLDAASATKEDLDDLKEHLTERIERSGDNIRTDVESMIARMERRLLVMGVPTIAAIVAILNYVMG